MQISLAVDQGTLLAAFQKAPLSVAKTLRTNLDIAMRDVARQARRDHRYKSKSSELNRSIQHEVSGDGMEGRAYINTGVAKYGVYQHEGTGLYGAMRRAYEVRAKGKSALYFVYKGKSILVPKKPYIGAGEKNPYWAKVQADNPSKTVSWKGHVTIKGIRPDHFLDRAFTAQKPYIIARMRGAVKGALAVAGLKGSK